MQKFNPTCLFAVHPDMERGVALLSRVVEYPYLASLGYVMVVVYWGEGEIMDIDSSYYDYVLSSRLAPAQKTQDDTPYQVYFTWPRVLVPLLVYCLLLLK